MLSYFLDFDVPSAALLWCPISCLTLMSHQLPYFDVPSAALLWCPISCLTLMSHQLPYIDVPSAALLWCPISCLTLMSHQLPRVVSWPAYGHFTTHLMINTILNHTFWNHLRVAQASSNNKHQTGTHFQTQHSLNIYNHILYNWWKLF